MVKVPSEILWVVLASFGGLAHVLKDILAGKIKFNIFLLIANMLVSGFSGLMFGFFGQSLGMGESTIYLLVGVGGYMGGESMKLLSEMTIKKYKESHP